MAFSSKNFAILSLIFICSVYGGLVQKIQEYKPIAHWNAIGSDILRFSDHSTLSLLEQPGSQKRHDEDLNGRSKTKAQIRRLVAELHHVDEALDTYRTGSSTFLHTMKSLLRTIEDAVSELRSQTDHSRLQPPTSICTECLRPWTIVPSVSLKPVHSETRFKPQPTKIPRKRVITVISTSTAFATLTLKETKTITVSITITPALTIMHPGKGHRRTHSRGNTSSASPFSTYPLPTSATIPITPAGSFDPLASNNVAVYYGQSPLTGSSNLLELCADPAVTIINLAFVSDFFGPGGYPKASFGPACNAPHTSSQQSVAPGLPNCSELGKQISTCQAVHGKKILVSLGGYVASSSFPSAKSARTFANNLWNLFGPGIGDDPLLRPFGPDVIVDGFDIDNEDHATNHWVDFAKALRRLYESPDAASSGKTYYLSSTPQCPLPDASIPAEVMAMSDFVNVQFYNNPACNLNAGQGFLSSFEAWSQSLVQSGSQGPRLFIAVPTWTGAGSGYVPGQALGDIVARAKKLAQEYNNFGGIAMWDGLEGLENVDSTGTNFIQYVADALG